MISLKICFHYLGWPSRKLNYLVKLDITAYRNIIDQSKYLIYLLIVFRWAIISNFTNSEERRENLKHDSYCGKYRHCAGRVKFHLLWAKQHGMYEACKENFRLLLFWFCSQFEFGWIIFWDIHTPNVVHIPIFQT